MKSLVAIHVAMKEEALGFAKNLELVEREKLDVHLGFREFYGVFGDNLEIRMFLHGTDSRHDVEQVGLEAAAVCSALYINKYNPRLIINFGTAGAFSSSGLKIGEVVLVRGPVLFHDRRVPLNGYYESQEGNHAVANITSLAAFLGIKSALLSSGSSLEMSPRDEELLRKQNVDLKEMECAAIAWIAEKKGIPLVSIKSITDLIDVPELVQEQFISNLAVASKNVQNVAVRALEYLDKNFEDPVWYV